MAADVFEAEDFSNLTHWQSLAWHGAPRDHWRDTVSSVNDCSRTALPPAPSGVAGMPRNHPLASVGITGWFASEYASEHRALQQQVRELHRLLGKKTLEVEILKEVLEQAGPKKRLLLRSPWPGQDGSR